MCDPNRTDYPPSPPRGINPDTGAWEGKGMLPRFARLLARLTWTEALLGEGG